MDALILECPVAGFVCELPAVPVAALAQERPIEGWQEEGSKVTRMYRGRKLVMDPLMADGRLLGWFKWLDGHFRGIDSSLENGERLLESEVENGESAWKRRQAWLDAGSPERRRRTS